MCDNIKTACLSESGPTPFTPTPRHFKVPTEHRIAPWPPPGWHWHCPAHRLSMFNVRLPYSPPPTQGADKNQKTTFGVSALEAAEAAENAEIKELLQ